MKSKETPPVPPVDEQKPESTVTPGEEQQDSPPLDPKEEARRRSRADLERNRSRMRSNRGKF